MDDSIEQRIERLERGASTFRRRLFMAFVAGTIIALGPAVAVANHIFVDVPTSSSFHADIERVYDARITAGCSAGYYCPDANVTRGQMAAFLARTGGRVAYDAGEALSIIDPEVVATVTIKPGNVTGGTAFVKLDASMYATSAGVDETGCTPCEVWFYLDQQNSPNQSLTNVAQVWNHSAGVAEYVPASLTFVVPVATGASVTFDLVAQRVNGSGTVNSIGSLSATYFPFGALGSDSLNP